jgi:hypothetical protein
MFRKPMLLPLSRCLLAVVLVLSSLFTLTGGVLAQAPVPAAADAAHNALNGVVNIDGGGFPSQALVIAWRGIRHPTASVDATTGAYTLALWDGDWQVTVVQDAPTTTSPNWVYTGGVQLVQFAGNPDPTNPIQTLNLSVTPATGTISGSLLPPAGATSFAAPNRVWVRAQDQEGQGNTVQVNETSGAFSVKVLPGNTILRFIFENPLWAPPVDLSGAQWFVDDGVTVAVDPIQLISKDARITGIVTDEQHHAVANLAVNAWRLDGALAVKGVTGPDGTYTLNVIQGVWEVQANPSNASNLVPAQSPQRVNLPAANSGAAQDLGVVLADVTVNGTLVDKNGAPVPGLEGRVYALYPDGIRWPQFGEGAPVHNSAFTLRLSSAISSQYRLKTSLSDLSGYVAISGANQPAAPGATYTITLPVSPTNSKINGHLIDRSDLQIQTGLPAAIYGASNSGAVKREKVNPITGGYQFNVASTDTSGQGGTYWWLKAFVDPTTGWAVQQPRIDKVFLPYNGGDGADVSADFLVAQVNAVISGLVTGPNGVALSGARVSVVEQATTSSVAFRRWTYTNDSGHYSLRVPAGKYKVTAEALNMIAPLPAYVTLLDSEKKTVDLQFRSKNAHVSGTVSYTGAAHTAFMRAYSSSGAHVSGLADLNGAWTLNLAAGETWWIQAVSEEGSLFLKSERIHFIPPVGVDPNAHSLTLQASESMPDSLVLDFDASEDQVLTLANGSQVVIPGGALQPSGMVSVAVHPKMDLSDSAGATPVSFGYRLLAFDENRDPILHFNAPITLVIPFTQAQLSQLAVNPEQLIPSYWDPSTGSWKAVESFSVQLFSDGSGTVSVMVDHFTDYGLMADTVNFQVFLPMTQH